MPKPMTAAERRANDKAREKGKLDQAIADSEKDEPSPPPMTMKEMQEKANRIRRERETEEREPEPKPTPSPTPNPSATPEPEPKQEDFPDTMAGLSAFQAAKRKWKAKQRSPQAHAARRLLDMA